MKFPLTIGVKMKKVIMASFAMLCVIACDEEAKADSKAAGQVTEQVAEQKAPAKESSAPANTFTDSRDGKPYRFVQIGKQTWMAENLNYETPIGSNCYNDSPQYCQKYGRLYSGSAAKKACPVGWHLPSKDEWLVFINSFTKKVPLQDVNYIGASKLKAKNDCPQLNDQQKQQVEQTLTMLDMAIESGNRSDEEIQAAVAMKTGYRNNSCTNDYGFSALMAGAWVFGSGYSDIGANANFLGQIINSEDNAFVVMLNPYDVLMIREMQAQALKASVRCVKD
jgi:uncharacterized protein (TIGR02145 family)